MNFDDFDAFIEESKEFSIDDSNKVTGPEFGSDQNDLFNSAKDAFNAGVFHAASDYSLMDHENARKNKERGTFSYDNGSKSVFFIS